MQEDVSDLSDDVEEVKGETESISDMLIKTVTDYTLSNGFIKYADGSIVSDGSYRYSSLIPVSVGESYTIDSDGSSSIFVVGMYEDDSSNADLNKSIRGINKKIHQDFVIPSGINYIRVCTSYGSLSSLKLTTKDKVFSISSQINRDRSLLFAEHRVAVINFQFDDGAVKDADIVSIFKAKKAVCGFSLLSTVDSSRVNNYLSYEADGFEILSHSTDDVGMNDSSVSTDVIEGKLKTSKKILCGYGFNVRGFVTPRSEMASVFLPLTKKYYDFAYTVYYGAYDGTGTPYFTKAGELNKLSRVSVQNTTLENMKAAVDTVIENAGFLTFYGHAADLDRTDYETTENLNSLLDYINEKQADLQCYLLKPSDAVDYYFHVRHEDYIELAN